MISIISIIIIVVVVSLIVIVLTLIVWISTNKEEFAIFVFFIFAFGSFFGVTGVLEIDKATLDHNVRAGVWKSKFDQVMIKARSLRGDPEFTQKLDYYDKMVNKK